MDLTWRGCETCMSDWSNGCFALANLRMPLFPHVQSAACICSGTKGMLLGEHEKGGHAQLPGINGQLILGELKTVFGQPNKLSSAAVGLAFMSGMGVLPVFQCVDILYIHICMYIYILLGIYMTWTICIFSRAAIWARGTTLRVCEKTFDKSGLSGSNTFLRSVGLHRPTPCVGNAFNLCCGLDTKPFQSRSVCGIQNPPVETTKITFRGEGR